MSRHAIADDGFRCEPYNFGSDEKQPPCWAYEDRTGLLIYTPDGHVGTLSWGTIRGMLQRKIVADAKRKRSRVSR